MLVCRVGGQSAPTGALLGDSVRLGLWSVLLVSLFLIKGWADLRMGCLPTGEEGLVLPEQLVKGRAVSPK